MASSITDRIRENQQKIKELSAQISVHSEQFLPLEVSGEIQNIQDRIRYRLLELEEKGQKVKIRGMQKVLSLLNRVV